MVPGEPPRLRRLTLPTDRQPILDSIRRSAETIASLEAHADALAAICHAVTECLLAGGKVMTMGHGGSAAQALHLAEELTGRFDRDRPPLPAIALVADPTLLTCIANDYGFERIFARQIEAHARQGDALVIFSTSGKGDGLRLAADSARQRGVTTIALLGKGGGPLADLVDHPLIIPSPETARIQEAHTLALHLILEAIERRMLD